MRKEKALPRFPKGSEAFASDRVSLDSRLSVKPYHVVPDASTEVVGEQASSTGVWVFSMVVFILTSAVVLGLSQLLFGRIDFFSIVVAAVAACLATSGVHIAQQWEKVVVLRLGK